MRHRRSSPFSYPTESAGTDRPSQRSLDREHRGRGGRSGRMFEHGRLRWVLLQLIDRKPSHGYELIKAIEESTLGSYTPSPGVIYPTLTLLEELGHVSVDASDGRKRYSITATGKAELQTQTTLPESRPPDAGLRHRGDLPLPILRAMENLKMALRLRIRHRAIDQQTATAIAATLDQAAQAIEQLTNEPSTAARSEESST